MLKNDEGIERHLALGSNVLLAHRTLPDALKVHLLARACRDIHAKALAPHTSPILHETSTNRQEAPKDLQVHVDQLSMAAIVYGSTVGGCRPGEPVGG